MKYFVVIMAVFWGTLHLSAQETDSLRVQGLQMKVDKGSIIADTIPEKKVRKTGAIKRFFEDYPNPNKALLLSFIVPGAGQIYNKKYIKLPFVFGAFGGLIYAIDYNTGNYRRFRDAYALKLDGEIHEFTGTTIDDAASLKRRRDDFRKNMELSYILLVIAYLLNGVDAYVDAHLLQFDVSEDLGLRIQPQTTLSGFSATPMPGVSVIFSLK
jgi:TM2 domain-containing membrane protein YozV